MIDTANKKELSELPGIWWCIDLSVEHHAFLSVGYIEETFMVIDGKIWVKLVREKAIEETNCEVQLREVIQQPSVPIEASPDNAEGWGNEAQAASVVHSDKKD